MQMYEIMFENRKKCSPSSRLGTRYNSVYSCKFTSTKPQGWLKKIPLVNDKLCSIVI